MKQALLIALLAGLVVVSGSAKIGQDYDFHIVKSRVIHIEPLSPPMMRGDHPLCSEANAWFRCQQPWPCEGRSRCQALQFLRL
jgi:hypothetical protein